MIKKLIPILMLLTGFIFSGCATKGYPGPELPADQVATIHFASDGPMALGDIYIDGNKIAASSYSIDYPAGSRKFSVSYTYDKTGHCTNPNACDIKKVSGKCEGNILTKGGLGYVVSLLNQNDVVTGKVAARGYYDLTVRPDEPKAGTISCK